MRPYDQKITELFDQVADSWTPEERFELRGMLEFGLTREAVLELLNEGICEEAATGTRTISGLPLLFTQSAQNDRGIWRNPHRVDTILANLPTAMAERRCISLVGRGWLLREGPIRIIFRNGEGGAQSVIFAIAVAGINPNAKIWRYFSQDKAEKLLESSSLYFCRLDKLTDDPQEGRLPLFQRKGRAQAFQTVFGEKTSDVIGEAEEIFRGTTYASCWTRREQESYLAWKHYCSNEGSRPGGGFAVVTTWRRLSHLHSLLRRHDENVHCRTVGYLDTIMDYYTHDEEGEQAFWKKRHFSDESEIRLAVRRIMSGSHSEILKHIKERMPLGQLIPCDLDLLVKEIVINPFASADQRCRLKKIIERHPRLLNRVRESEIITPAE